MKIEIKGGSSDAPKAINEKTTSLEKTKILKWLKLRNLT
jgi:hypothetical protein